MFHVELGSLHRNSKHADMLCIVSLVCDLKAAWISVQRSLIQQLTLYEFERRDNVVETAKKNICCVKGKDAVDYSSVNRWFKKFPPGCKKLDDQVDLEQCFKS